MKVKHLSLTRFRSYDVAEVDLAPDVTAVVGANGQGKTNLIEAVGWLATADSFRGAPEEALIRAGSDQAILRAEAERDGRDVLIEAELNRRGRNRIQVNRQRVARAGDLAAVLRITVFAPDDLDLVKGGPAGRRRFLDDLAVATRPQLGAVRAEAERTLRQRNALLRQAGGRAGPDVVSTLDVWDAKYAACGTELTEARRRLVSSLRPEVEEVYRSLSNSTSGVAMALVEGWDGRGAGLGAALREARADDLRRGLTTVGPHRDELTLTVDGLPARTHASQGEQRTLALSLRIAGHRVVHAAAGEAPLLLLDDVFSELDESRSAALVSHLPAAQTILTTAGPLPPGIRASSVLTVRDGAVHQG